MRFFYDVEIIVDQQIIMRCGEEFVWRRIIVWSTIYS